MRLRICVPNSLKDSGVLEGLLGNFNSDPVDDYITAGNQQYDRQSVGDGELFIYGETCKKLRLKLWGVKYFKTQYLKLIKKSHVPPVL